MKTIIAVGRVTFQEILLDRVLYNLILFGLLLLGVGMIASTLTFISPERIILDFGFSAINLACFILAALHGSTIFPKEYDRRTIWVALARPISKIEFVAGKWLGLSGVIALNWVLLAGIEYVLYISAGGTVSLTYFESLFLLLLQSIMVAALSFVFSSFSTTSVSVMVMIGVYLIGNNISDLVRLKEKMDSGVLKSVLGAFVALLPNLEHFNLGFTVTYHLPIAASFLFTSVIYAGIWISIALVAASVFLNHREREA